MSTSESMLCCDYRSNLYKAACNDTCELPDMTLLHLSSAYEGMPRETAPLITTMEVSSDVPLVDCAFGKVQEGSLLSYFLPTVNPPKTTLHAMAPPRPPLPVEDYHLGPTNCSFVHTHHQQLHMASLETPHRMATRIEESTRQQTSVQEWHLLRRTRVTSSRFRYVMFFYVCDVSYEYALLHKTSYLCTVQTISKI